MAGTRRFGRNGGTRPGRPGRVGVPLRAPGTRRSGRRASRPCPAGSPRRSRGRWVLPVFHPESQCVEDVAGLVAEGHRDHRVGPAVLPEDREASQARRGIGRHGQAGDPSGVRHHAAEEVGARQHRRGGHRGSLAEADEPDARGIGAVGVGGLPGEVEDGVAALHHLLEVDPRRRLRPVDVEPRVAHGLGLAGRPGRHDDQPRVEPGREPEQVLLVGAEAVQQERHGRPGGLDRGGPREVLEGHGITRSAERFAGRPGADAGDAGSLRPARRPSRATTLPTRS